MKENRIPLRFLIPPAAFALICVFYFALDFYLTSREKQLRSELEQVAKSRAFFDQNTSANRLRILAFDVGVFLQSGRILEPPPQFISKSARFRAVWDELNHYVKAEALDSGPLVEVPDETRKFLQESDEAVGTIREFLVHHDAPRWKQEQSLEAQFEPILIGVIRLHHILAARAISDMEAGNLADSERGLFACWKLNESLGYRQEAVSIIVAMKCSLIEFGLLKKLPSMSPQWTTRIKRLDPRKNLATALFAESMRVFDGLGNNSFRRELLNTKAGGLPEWLKPTAATMLDPYFRLARLNYLAIEMEAIHKLQQGGKPETRARDNPFFRNFFHDYESISNTLREFEEMQAKCCSK